MEPRRGQSFSEGVDLVNQELGWTQQGSLEELMKSGELTPHEFGHACRQTRSLNRPWCSFEYRDRWSPFTYKHKQIVTDDDWRRYFSSTQKEEFDDLLHAHNLEVMWDREEEGSLAPRTRTKSGRAASCSSPATGGCVGEGHDATCQPTPPWRTSYDADVETRGGRRGSPHAYGSSQRGPDSRQEGARC